MKGTTTGLASRPRPPPVGLLGKMAQQIFAVGRRGGGGEKTVPVHWTLIPSNRSVLLSTSVVRSPS